jgi:hypothetical protein
MKQSNSHNASFNSPWDIHSTKAHLGSHVINCLYPDQTFPMLSTATHKTIVHCDQRVSNRTDGDTEKDISTVSSF